jgi:hypothetical protein
MCKDSHKSINVLFWFLFFCNTGVWSQSLMLARQTLYHSNHIPSPFCYNYFSDIISCYCPCWPRILTLLSLPHCSWDYKGKPLHLAYIFYLLDFSCFFFNNKYILLLSLVKSIEILHYFCCALDLERWLLQHVLYCPYFPLRLSQTLKSFLWAHLRIPCLSPKTRMAAPSFQGLGTLVHKVFSSLLSSFNLNLLPF